MSCTMETIRRVFDDENGVFIEVGPDMDALGVVEVRTSEPESKKWWGEIRFAMEPEFAKKLGEAIIMAAEELERRRK